MTLCTASAVISELVRVVPEELVRKCSVRKSGNYFALTCNRLRIGTHQMGDQMAGACATGGEKRDIYRVLVRIPEGKGLLGGQNLNYSTRLNRTGQSRAASRVIWQPERVLMHLGDLGVGGGG